MVPKSPMRRAGGRMFETLFTGFIGGVCGWFFTDFVAKPLLRFSDLRREVTRCLVVYGNVGGQMAIDKAGNQKTLKLSAEEDARLVEAQKSFRDLSGKMYGFSKPTLDHTCMMTKGERIRPWSRVAPVRKLNKAAV